MRRDFSTMVPVAVRDRLAEIAGKGGLGPVAERILARFEGRLLASLIDGFPRISDYLGSTPWVRLSMRIEDSMKEEIEAADECLPALKRMYIIGALFACEMENLEALAGREDSDASRSTAAAA